jgi:hypothetical protein
MWTVEARTKTLPPDTGDSGPSYESITPPLPGRWESLRAKDDASTSNFGGSARQPLIQQHGGGGPLEPYIPATGSSPSSG